MISVGPKYLKLKTNLQLATTRCRILEAKKKELSKRLKLKIVNHLQNGQYMKARMNAENLIRHKATIEAYQMLEVYCQQMLDRYELFRQKKKPDASLLTPIISLIWVSPYFVTHISELKCISKQLIVKYGNRFGKAAVTNENGRVSPELMNRVQDLTSTEEQLENCLKNICEQYSIDYYAVKKTTDTSKIPCDKTDDRLERNDNTEYRTESNNTSSVDKDTADKLVSQSSQSDTLGKSLDESRENLTWHNPNKNSQKGHDGIILRNFGEMSIEKENFGMLKENKYDMKQSLFKMRNEKDFSNYVIMHGGCILPYLQSLSNENPSKPGSSDPPPSYSEITDNQATEKDISERNCSSFQLPTCPEKSPSYPEITDSQKTERKICGRNCSSLQLPACYEKDQSYSEITDNQETEGDISGRNCSSFQLPTCPEEHLSIKDIQETEREISVTNCSSFQLSTCPEEDPSFSKITDNQEIGRKISGRNCSSFRSPTYPEENLSFSKIMANHETEREISGTNCSSFQLSIYPEEDTSYSEITKNQETEREISGRNCSEFQSPTCPEEDLSYSEIMDIQETEREISLTNCWSNQLSTYPEEDPSYSKITDNQETEKEISERNFSSFQSPAYPKEDLSFSKIMDNHKTEREISGTNCSSFQLSICPDEDPSYSEITNNQETEREISGRICSEFQSPICTEENLSYSEMTDD